MIHQTLSRSLAALAIAAFACGISSWAVLANDERPDLKIELIGLPLAPSQREVQVKITNVSKWWSDETKLRVETTPAGSGSVLNRDVENLDPGQSVTFRYTLAAACGAQSPDGRFSVGFDAVALDVKVRATVSAGKNYEGVMESGDLLKNNSAETSACAAITPPTNTGTKPAECSSNAKPDEDTQLSNVLFGDYFYLCGDGDLQVPPSDSNP